MRQRVRTSLAGTACAVRWHGEQRGHGVAVKRFGFGADLRGGGGEGRDAGRADDQHSRAFAQEADGARGASFLHQTEGAREGVAEQRTNERAGGGFDRLRQAGEAFDHQRGGDCAKIGIETDVEEAAFGQIAVQLRVGQGKASLMQRRTRIGTSQRVDRVEDRDLIVGEGQVHQRGSRGSLRTSVAMMLS